MKRFVTCVWLFATIASPALAQTANQSSTESAPVKDALGTWQIRHFPQAGISVDTPCNPEVSYSDPQDGYRHAIDEVELRCHIGPLWPPGISFRIDVRTYKNDPNVIREQFQRYMDLIQSLRAGANKAPRVMIAGQQNEVHQDFTLSKNAAHGDLGFHETANECFWNFFGLAGNSIIQAVMSVPKEMCPKANQPILSDAAARFYDSIAVDGVS